MLAEVRRSLQELAEFDEAGVERALREIIEARGAKPRQVYQPLRVALTGGTVSPGIFESVALLGPRADAWTDRRGARPRLSPRGAQPFGGALPIREHRPANHRS